MAIIESYITSAHDESFPNSQTRTCGYDAWLAQKAANVSHDFGNKNCPVGLSGAQVSESALEMFKGVKKKERP